MLGSVVKKYSSLPNTADAVTGGTYDNCDGLPRPYAGHCPATREDLGMESGYQPIENYGLIGNLRTVALVGMDGSIDWLCLPRFDSPSVFAAVLDDQKGGRFRIAPAGEQFRRKQFYWPDTAILVTRFLD